MNAPVQMTLTLADTPATRASSLCEAVAGSVYRLGLKHSAGIMDMSPSHLSEALSGGRNRKVGLDELEALVAAGDLSPVEYLLKRYACTDGARMAANIAAVQSAAAALQAAMADAGLSKKGRK
jgi:hypothetical protein